MNIDIEHKTAMSIEAYFDGNTLKTYNCEIGGWWGHDRCEQIDIT